MNALKLNRILRGWSQDTLAAAVGLSQTTYSRIERGVRYVARDECQRIAEALGVPAETLLGGSLSPTRNRGALRQGARSARPYRRAERR